MRGSWGKWGRPGAPADGLACPPGRSAPWLLKALPVSIPRTDGKGRPIAFPVQADSLLMPSFCGAGKGPSGRGSAFHGSLAWSKWVRRAASCSPWVKAGSAGQAGGGRGGKGLRMPLWEETLRSSAKVCTGSRERSSRSLSLCTFQRAKERTWLCQQEAECAPAPLGLRREPAATPVCPYWRK